LVLRRAYKSAKRGETQLEGGASRQVPSQRPEQTAPPEGKRLLAFSHEIGVQCFMRGRKRRCLHQPFENSPQSRRFVLEPKPCSRRRALRHTVVSFPTGKKPDKKDVWAIGCFSPIETFPPYVETNKIAESSRLCA